VTNLDGLKIFIVDDERFMRLTIRTVLRAVGRFIVTEADDGDVALAEIESSNPDVVLCDITMPRMGGLRFVELLRNHSEVRMRETPVIILTGHAEEATVIAASKLRINGYVIKPVSSKQLSDQLQRVLAARLVAPLATAASDGS
jgi:two-component system, chemotaxis family, chemotaxis protein CheY